MMHQRLEDADAAILQLKGQIHDQEEERARLAAEWDAAEATLKERVSALEGLHVAARLELEGAKERLSASEADAEQRRLESIALLNQLSSATAAMEVGRDREVRTAQQWQAEVDALVSQMSAVIEQLKQHCTDFVDLRHKLMLVDVAMQRVLEAEVYGRENAMSMSHVNAQLASIAAEAAVRHAEEVATLNRRLAAAEVHAAEVGPLRARLALVEAAAAVLGPLREHLAVVEAEAVQFDPLHKPMAQDEGSAGRISSALTVLVEQIAQLEFDARNRAVDLLALHEQKATLLQAAAQAAHLERDKECAQLRQEIAALRSQLQQIQDEWADRYIEIEARLRVSERLRQVTEQRLAEERGVSKSGMTELAEKLDKLEVKNRATAAASAALMQELDRHAGELRVFLQSTLPEVVVVLETEGVAGASRAMAPHTEGYEPTSLASRDLGDEELRGMAFLEQVRLLMSYSRRLSDRTWQAEKRMEEIHIQNRLMTSELSEVGRQLNAVIEAAAQALNAAAATAAASKLSLSSARGRAGKGQHLEESSHQAAAANGGAGESNCGSSVECTPQRDQDTDRRLRIGPSAPQTGPDATSPPQHPAESVVAGPLTLDTEPLACVPAAAGAVGPRCISQADVAAQVEGLVSLAAHLAVLRSCSEAAEAEAEAMRAEKERYQLELDAYARSVSDLVAAASRHVSASASRRSTFSPQQSPSTSWYNHGTAEGDTDAEHQQQDLAVDLHAAMAALVAVPPCVPAMEEELSGTLADCSAGRNGDDTGDIEGAVLDATHRKELGALRRHMEALVAMEAASLERAERAEEERLRLVTEAEQLKRRLQEAKECQIADACRVDVLLGERHDLELRLDQLTARYAHENLAYEELKTKHELLQQSWKEQAVSLGQLRQDSEDLRSQIVKLNAGRCELADRCDELTEFHLKALTEANETISELRAQYMAAQADLQGSMENNGSLSMELRAKQAELDEAAAELVRVATASEALVARNEALVAENGELLQNHEALGAEFEMAQSQIAEAQSQVAELDAQRDQLAAERDMLHGQLVELQAVRDELQAKLDVMEAMAAEMQRSCSALKEENLALKDAAEGAEMLRVALHAQHEELQQQQQALQIQYEDALKQCEYLDAQLVEGAEREAELVMHLEELEEEAQAQRQHAVEAEAEIKRLAEMLDAQFEETNIFYAAAERTNSLLGNAHNRVDELTEEIAQLRASLENEAELRGAYVVETAQLRAALKEATAEWFTLSDEITQLRTSSQTAIEERDALRVQSATLQASLKDRTAQLETLEVQAMQLGASLSEQRDTLEADAMRLGASLLETTEMRDALEADVMRLRAALKERTTQRDILESEAMQLGASLQEKIENCHALEAKVEHLHLNLQERTEQRDKLGVEAAQLESSLQERTEQRDELVAEAAELKASLQERTEQHNVLAAEAAQLKSSLQERTQQLDALALEAAQLKLLLQEMTEQRDALAAEAAQLKMSLQERTEQRDELVDEAAQLKSSLQERMEQRDALAAEAAQLRSSLLERTTQYNELVNEAAKLQASLQDRTDQLDALAAEEAQLELSLQERTQRHDALAAEAAQLKTCLHERMEQYDELAAEAAQLKSSLQERMEQYAELTAAAAELKFSLEKRTEEHEALLIEAAQLKSSLQGRMKEYLELAKEAAQLKSSLQEKTQQYNELAAEAAQLKASLQERTEQRDELAAEAAQLKSSLQERTEQRDELAAEAAQLKASLQERTEQRDELEDEAAQLKASLQERTEQRDELEEEAAQLKSSLQERTEQRDELAAEAAQLKASLQERTEQRDELVAEEARLLALLHERTEELDARAEAAAQYHASLQERTEQLEALVKEVAKLQATVQERTEQYDVLLVESTQLRMSLHERTEQRDILEVEITQLKASLQQANERRDVLEMEGTQLLGDLHRSTQQRDAAEAEATQLRISLSERTDQRDELEVEVTQLKASLKQANERHDALEEETTSLRTALLQATEQHNAVEAEAVQVKASLQERTEQRDALETEMTNLKVFLQQAIERRNALEEETALLRSALQQATEQHNAVEAEAVQVKASLQERTEQRDALEAEIDVLKVEATRREAQLEHRRRQSDDVLARVHAKTVECCDLQKRLEEDSVHKLREVNSLLVKRIAKSQGNRTMVPTASPQDDDSMVDTSLAATVTVGLGVATCSVGDISNGLLGSSPPAESSCVAHAKASETGLAGRGKVEAAKRDDVSSAGDVTHAVTAAVDSSANRSPGPNGGQLSSLHRLLQDVLPKLESVLVRAPYVAASPRLSGGGGLPLLPNSLAPIPSSSSANHHPSITSQEVVSSSPGLPTSGMKRDGLTCSSGTPGARGHIRSEGGIIDDRSAAAGTWSPAARPTSSSSAAHPVLGPLPSYITITSSPRTSKAGHQVTQWDNSGASVNSSSVLRDRQTASQQSSLGGADGPETGASFSLDCSPLPSPMLSHLLPPVPSRISLERGGRGAQGGFVNPMFVYTSPLRVPTHNDKDSCEWLPQQDEAAYEMVDMLRQVLEVIRGVSVEISTDKLK
ncbi:hypothetical protein Vretifemale_10821 [Volvox reticuliferus]|uniref:Uncharacterized protein n=1 Tax=Volvox reticuliferus TaxID=1737510 RepID=A0A8J4CHJ3_9CHLO|nr:hypothetical protein Vretifemale_10821 [Volvox reticuliferus]